MTAGTLLALMRMDQFEQLERIRQLQIAHLKAAEEAAKQSVSDAIDQAWERNR